MISEIELKRKLEYYKEKNAQAKKEYELKAQIKQEREMMKQYKPNLLTKLVDRIREIWE